MGEGEGREANLASWSLGQVAAPLPERKCRKYVRIYRKCSSLISAKCLKSVIGLGDFLLVVRANSLALFTDLV